METRDFNREPMKSETTVLNQMKSEQNFESKEGIVVESKVSNVIQDTVEQGEMIDSTGDNSNWTQICRICACMSDHIIPVFEGEGAEHELSDKIHKYLPIKVSEIDDLPRQLCYHCAATILAWDELLEGCLDAEKRLIQMQDELHGQEQTQLPYEDTTILHELAEVADGLVREQTLTEGSLEELIDDPDPVGPQDSKHLMEVVEQGAKNLEATGSSNVSKRFDAGTATDFAAFCRKRSDATAGSSAIKLVNARKHGRQSHPSDSVIEATQSDANDVTHASTDSSSPRSHRVTKSNDGRMSCDKCSRIFKKESYLKRHVTYCRGKYKKNKCTDEINEKQTEDSELTNEEEATTSLNDENLENDKVVDAREHELKKRKRLPNYPCLYCDFTVKRKKYLDLHMTECHSEMSGTTKEKKRRSLDKNLVEQARMEVNGRVYYHCNECGKNLFSPYTFSWHVRIHTGERAFTCHLCGKQFRINQGLARHLRDTHAGIKKFSCDICGRMFSTKRNVEDHRRIHTGERPFVCNMCGKSFKQKASLFVHNRTHTDFFPFKCSYCNQGFRTRPPLVVHMTKHTGEKPHPCDICNRRFRIKFELKRHRLIHFDEKPWQCSDCGLSFRQKRYLVNHKKINHSATSLPSATDNE